MADDDQDALAAEYVLGTLSADERAQAEAMLSIDAGFAEAVRQWERRLGELNVMVEAVEPSPEVWDKIKTEIGEFAPGHDIPLSTIADDLIEPAAQPEGKPAPKPEDEKPSGTLAFPSGLTTAVVPPADAADRAALSDSITAALAHSIAKPSDDDGVPIAEATTGSSADVVYLARRVSHWRRMTIVMGALAAVLALVIAVSRVVPALNPSGPRSTQVAAKPAAPAAPVSRLVAVLQQEPTAPAFLLTVDPLSRTLTVRRVSATAESGRSYELWLLSGGAPRSLGIVGNGEFTQHPIPANLDVNAMRSANYAVSLEPAGGSTRGVPTGPILFTGKMVESLPTAAPAPRT